MPPYERKARPPIPETADWIVEGKVAAMSLPSHEDLLRLRDAGFGLVVNLTEKPGPTTVAAAAGLKGAHLPLEDMAAPELEQIEDFVQAVDRHLAQGRPVAVHCMGGVGRTGTMIAAWLVHHGMQPAEAIEEVRRRRPGSIESAEQERAVFDYARHRGGIADWSRSAGR